MNICWSAQRLTINFEPNTKIPDKEISELRKIYIKVYKNTCLKYTQK